MDRIMPSLSPFQSTLPARGATDLSGFSQIRVYISIHAPREGSDSCSKFFAGSNKMDFNPRSPRGERPIVIMWIHQHFLFQSTLPARGATLTKEHPEEHKNISIHAPREGSDSNIAQIFTIRTAILQHGYQTRLVFGTKSIVLNRKKSFKLPVFLREPTGLFMFTSGSRHGRSKNQRVGHIYGGACTDVLNLSLI